MTNRGERWTIEQMLGRSGGGLLRPLRDGLGVTMPGDDAARTADDGLVSVDTMVEGVHFDDRLSPADVGWKLIAVNVSDLGACGRAPQWALLSLSLPRPLDEGWVQQFAAGMRRALERWGVALIGGDTTRTAGPRVVSLTIGSASGGPAVSRGGARSGDQLWVSGTLGEAATGFFHGLPAGLRWLQRPEPPVRLGVALAQAGQVRAMMDLSDGLANDLPRLCEASGVGATVWPDALPAGAATRHIADQQEREALMTAFGEDYQLLFAAPPENEAAIRAIAAEQDVSVSPIGVCTAAETEVRLHGRTEWPAARFTHFGSAPEP